MDEQINSGEAMPVEEVSRKTKVQLCALAWFIAVVAMALVESGQSGAQGWMGVLCPPVLTPAGLAMLYVGGRIGGGILAPIAGWIYYIALTVWCVRAKRKVVFMWVWIILCVSMLLNIAGCASLRDFHMGC